MGNPPQVMVIGGARLLRDSLSNALSALGFDIVSLSPQKSTAVRKQTVVILLVVDALLEATAVEIQRCRNFYHDCKILALIPVNDDNSQVRLLDAGASVCIQVSEPLEQLAAAIIQLGAPKAPGEISAGATIYDSIVNTVDPDARLHVNSRLTARELEVFHFIEAGLSNKEISRELTISTSTVKNHVHNILSKLQLRRRREALSWVSIRARGNLRSARQRIGLGNGN